MTVIIYYGGFGSAVLLLLMMIMLMMLLLLLCRWITVAIVCLCQTMILPSICRLLEQRMLSNDIVLKLPMNFLLR